MIQTLPFKYYYLNLGDTIQESDEFQHTDLDNSWIETKNIRLTHEDKGIVYRRKIILKPGYRFLLYNEATQPNDELYLKGKWTPIYDPWITPTNPSAIIRRKIMLTPQQAFEHIKVLWPDTTKIEHCDGHEVKIIEDNNKFIYLLIKNIEWTHPQQYPFPPEIKWRDAKPEDVCFPFKEARFRDHNYESWVEGFKLHGWFKGLTEPWYDKDAVAWQFCQVKDE